MFDDINGIFFFGIVFVYEWYFDCLWMDFKIEEVFFFDFLFLFVVVCFFLLVIMVFRIFGLCFKIVGSFC